MFNRLFSFYQRPEKGWDPIPKSYASKYAENQYLNIDFKLIDRVENFAGGTLQRKSLLDVGGGPGHYSLEFAKKGAMVTWSDISSNYMQIVKKKAEREKVKLSYKLEYLDEINGQFDIVFNRICWYYCFNDYSFARRIVETVKKKGCGYLIISSDKYYKNAMNNFPIVKRFLLYSFYYVHEISGIKIGRPHPSHKRIKRVFRKLTLENISIERAGDCTIVKFIK